jgi:predicted phosphodiesterase
MAQEPVIVTRNKDVEHIVNAAANQGHYSATKPKDPRFTILCAADVHGREVQMNNMVDYLNYMDCIDAAIHLGDMQPGDFAQNDGTWYVNAVARAEKPFFSVVGNHDGGNSATFDICGTVQQVFDKFFAPVKEKTGIENLTKAYYSKNFDEYGVTIIVLNNYDTPDDLAENGDFAVKAVEKKADAKK